MSANLFLVAFSDGKPVPTFPENALEVVRRAPRRAGSGLVKLYRYTLSGFVGFECRHLPTCSAYAEEAIGRFGDPLTGEACGLSYRILCDVTEAGRKTLAKALGIPNLTLPAAWNRGTDADPGEVTFR